MNGYAAGQPHVFDRVQHLRERVTPVSAELQNAELSPVRLDFFQRRVEDVDAVETVEQLTEKAPGSGDDPPVKHGLEPIAWEEAAGRPQHSQHAWTLTHKGSPPGEEAVL